MVRPPWCCSAVRWAKPSYTNDSLLVKTNNLSWTSNWAMATVLFCGLLGGIHGCWSLIVRDNIILVPHNSRLISPVVRLNIGTPPASGQLLLPRRSLIDMHIICLVPLSWGGWFGSRLLLVSCCSSSQKGGASHSWAPLCRADSWAGWVESKVDWKGPIPRTGRSFSTHWFLDCCLGYVCVV